MNASVLTTQYIEIQTQAIFNKIYVYHKLKIGLKVKIYKIIQGNPNQNEGGMATSEFLNIGNIDIWEWIILC